MPRSLRIEFPDLVSSMKWLESKDRPSRLKASNV
jgi:hypothetical protein